MGIVIGVVLLALAAAVYARHMREAGWLLGLRLAVVLLLAAILVDWVLAYHWSTRPRRVVVLLDRSQSMSVAGADTLALAAAGRFPLPPGIRPEYWVFGDTAKRVSGFEEQKGGAGDRHTRMGSALKTVLRTRPGAVVMLSDGQDNGGIDPVSVAGQSRTPVYAVGCGAAGMRNLEVVRLTLPPVTYAGDTVFASGRMRYSGFHGEEVMVRMGGQATKALLKDETAEQDFSFKLVFDQPGAKLVKFSADSMPAEATYLDNEREAMIEVLPSRTRVAYVTNRPGPETRFITSALRQEPRVQLVTGIMMNAERGAMNTELRAQNSALSTQHADVFVLDGIAEGANDEMLSGIAAQVRKGAGALILAGPDFKAGKVLTGLLPGGAQVTARQGSFAPALTGAGRMVSWVGDIQFDKVSPFNLVLAPQPGAQAEEWLVAGEPPLPMVLAYRVGRGRVAYVAGYPLWRWGFGPDVTADQDPLELFLSGVVRYLAEQDRDRFRLSADKPVLYLGEPVRLALTAEAPDGSAWAGLDASVSVDSGQAVPMVEQTSGVYEAELPAVGAGTHSAVAVVRFADSVLGRASAGLVVSEREVEMAGFGLNRELLVSLAQASGGEYFRWDSLPQEGFEPALATIRHGFGFQPRRNAWVYALIAALVGLEMVLRRRKGLL